MSRTWRLKLKKDALARALSRHLFQELPRHQRALSTCAEYPELMRSARRCDVQQVPRFLVIRVAPLRNFYKHHIVEFEPFDLSHVSHVHTGSERKLLIVDASKLGDFSRA